MDLLLILTYLAICIGVFKVFKIPLNKWTVPTAILGGVLLLGSLLFIMNYNHPFSESGREYFVSVPIVPSVSGQVIAVPVSNGSLLEEGEVLFQIDPVPFQARRDSLVARLSAASSDLERAQKLIKSGSITRRELDNALAAANDLQAQLVSAEYDLANTTVRAPSRGIASQVFLRPGVFTVAMPLRPAMVFIPEEGLYFSAWFRQNSMLRLKTGDEAEIAFDGIPGKVFKGRVTLVSHALKEGQVSASGSLVGMENGDVPGRIPVIIEITDPEYKHYAQQVPGGAFGQAAIYSEHFEHVAIMRKILLRMSSWMNYLYPFH